MRDGGGAELPGPRAPLPNSRLDSQGCAAQARARSCRDCSTPWPPPTRDTTDRLPRPGGLARATGRDAVFRPCPPGRSSCPPGSIRPSASVDAPRTSRADRGMLCIEGCRPPWSALATQRCESGQPMTGAPRHGADILRQRASCQPGLQPSAATPARQRELPTRQSRCRSALFGPLASRPRAPRPAPRRRHSGARHCLPRPPRRRAARSEAAAYASKSMSTRMKSPR
jgi:hypothetical protein